MTGTTLSADDQGEFLDRFSHFEDGVITGIRLQLPRTGGSGWTAEFDVQAVDGADGDEWRLVRITLSGLYEYEFPLSRQYSYFVLSDGLNLDCTAERCLLDLDPGPDPWTPAQVGQPGEYSKQYAIGTSCTYEVLDGPFI
ncbi:hypothetical protein [Kitasatospora viridis]|uniref:Uncharacterized protein n=1 Tax=Kitasatospora viridis TaxID=281105 RepID=A0A561UER4_9ACTN|nr:hypothetical protein [Kitasatospora viridis]TWF97852.1 hypothetical protein FHX73_111653 [Kitasatospora viridis]